MTDVNAVRTFLRVYLLVYYVLLLGAGLTLWRSGLLARFPTVWVVAVGISAISLGLLLAAVSRKG